MDRAQASAKRLRPQEIAKLLQQAVDRHEAGRPDETERLCREVLATAPDHTDALQFLGVARASQGDSAGAITLLRQAVAQRPNDPRLHLNLAVAMLPTKQWAEAADSYQQQGKLVEFLEAVVVPALALADEDVRRGRISKEKATEIAKTLSDTLDEVWSEEGDYDRKDAPVILIPAHGPINFAATLAFSALLNLKHIPHRMLSQDVLLPGITVDQDDKASIVGLIGLSPLTASQQRYMSRRLAPRIGEAKLLNIAWRETAGETEAVLASQAPSMRPRAQAEVSAAAA